MQRSARGLAAGARGVAAPAPRTGGRHPVPPRATAEMAGREAMRAPWRCMAVVATVHDRGYTIRQRGGLLAILGLVPLSLPRAEQTLPPWTIRTPPPLASDATWRWRLGLDIDRMCHLISRRVHHLGSHLADSFSRTDQTIQDPHHAGR